MKDPVRNEKPSKDSKCRMLKGVDFRYYLPCSASRNTWYAEYKQNEVSFRNASQKDCLNGFRIVRNK